MFKEVMQHNTIIELPLFALFLFLAVFVAVSVHVWRRGAANPDHQRLANLPLEDDDAPMAQPTHPTHPGATQGGDHGRQ